jgi:hypothetical protein
MSTPTASIALTVKTALPQLLCLSEGCQTAALCLCAAPLRRLLCYAHACHGIWGFLTHVSDLYQRICACMLFLIRRPGQTPLVMLHRRDILD